MVRALFIVPAFITLLVIVSALIRRHVFQPNAAQVSLGFRVLWIIAMALALAGVVAPSNHLRQAGYGFLEIFVLPSPGYFIALTFAPLIWRKHPKLSARIALVVLATVCLMGSLVWSDQQAKMLSFSGMSGIILYIYWFGLLAVNAAAALWQPRDKV